MLELIVGMSGSLIVLGGFALGYGLGARAARKEQPKVIATGGKEEVPDKITVEEQLENLMTYTGRAE